MKVLFVASEAAPFIKTGGLADVMGALPKALQALGVEPALVIPNYEGVGEAYKNAMETVYEGSVDLSWRNQYLGVKKLVQDGIPVYFIDNEYYFKRDKLYGYDDDAERFAYFSKAALAMLNYIDFKPDVIHTNDWHTGLLGAYLKEDFMQDPYFQGMKNVYTIHNLKYQGVFGRNIVEDVLGLPLRLLYIGNIENAGDVNFMKAGMCYADFITTVSPSYAEEITYPYFGEGLEDYVALCAGKISGILNGLDEQEYNPETDPYIPVRFDASNVLVKKPLAKEALQRELGLTVNREIPVLGMITRLVEAKGLDLVMHIMDELMEEQVQLVVVGTGDEEYANALRELAWRHPGSVSVNILFNEGLARRVYAGSDMFIMPSRYEACGLSQMIAMRYGTVPVVRETGGLKDSVINFDKYNTPEGNGFSFANFNAHELLFTIKRGLTCYAAKPLWEKVVYNAMHSDNSWNRSAQAYADLYAHIAGDTITVEPVSEDQVAEAAEEILQAVKGEEPAEETGNTAAAAAETAEAEKAVQAANEEVLAETAPEAEQVPAPETKAEAEKAPEKPEEPEAAAEPVKKKTAAKRTTKKAADKTTETKKTTAKKATAKKATTKKSAAATEEGAAVKKTTARKTTAKKKADTTADVTTEAAEAAAPKKRGRKPGTKNTKKDAE
ncbi:glycogen synthase GlgA [Succiniclasticum ruminis]|uniref:Glycogen synthase n=1 Tax=Succiniclasticum ruminis DSM 9236 TaxID=1123323 RepID=A0A1I2E7F1_9FIRM|nr:glycogen synthase GlgA [Succiniclasticum ruminis]SFE88775.1 starch synthase [Succiniclasticum ruminis DSM 9236]